VVVLCPSEYLVSHGARLFGCLVLGLDILAMAIPPGRDRMVLLVAPFGSSLCCAKPPPAAPVRDNDGGISDGLLV
jgi:hypothetical protein